MLNYDNGLDIFLLKNKYFETLVNNKYNLNIYQNNNINFCLLDQINIRNCYNYYPINSIKDKKGFISTFLYSLSLPNAIQNYLAKKEMITSFARTPTIQQQKEILNQAQNDIVSGFGNNIYFIHLSSLSKPYLYDSNCEIKTVKESDESMYIDQLACTYKQLDSFISALAKQDKLKNTKIIIHGLSGANLKKDTIRPDFSYSDNAGMELAKDTHLTTFGLFNSKNQKFTVDTEACDITTLLLHSLGSKSTKCKSVNISSFSPENPHSLHKKINNWFNSISFN